METIHLHHDPRNNSINVLLLLLPSVVFALIIFSYFFLKANNNPYQIATEANPALGSEINTQNYSVLGDQDTFDTYVLDSLE